MSFCTLPNAFGSGVAAPKDTKAETETETAIVIWDAEKKTQTLILLASLPSDSALLVPTPTEPSIAPASQEAIDALYKLTAPRTEIKTKTVTPEFGWPRLEGFGNWGTSAPTQTAIPKPTPAPQPPAPKTTKVPLSEPDKVSEWMSMGGYEARPALKDWLKIYADKNWTVTAITPADPSTGVISPIALTFKTDTPIYPYREPVEGMPPAGANAQSRLLRVFVIADARYDGTVGETAAWPAKTVFAKQADPGAIAKEVKAPSGGWWVTELEDYSSPRPATDDITFKKATDQTPIERTPNEVYLVNEMPPAWAVNLAALIGLIVLAILLITRNRKKKSPPTTPAATNQPDLL